MVWLCDYYGITVLLLCDYYVSMIRMMMLILWYYCVIIMLAVYDQCAIRMWVSGDYYVFITLLFCHYNVSNVYVLCYCYAIIVSLTFHPYVIIVLLLYYYYVILWYCYVVMFDYDAITVRLLCDYDMGIVW